MKFSGKNQVHLKSVKTTMKKTNTYQANFSNRSSLYSWKIQLWIRSRQSSRWWTEEEMQRIKKQDPQSASSSFLGDQLKHIIIQWDFDFILWMEDLSSCVWFDATAPDDEVLLTPSHVKLIASRRLKNSSLKEREDENNTAKKEGEVHFLPSMHLISKSTASWDQEEETTKGWMIKSNTASSSSFSDPNVGDVVTPEAFFSWLFDFSSKRSDSKERERERERERSASLFGVSVVVTQICYSLERWKDRSASDSLFKSDFTSSFSASPSYAWKKVSHPSFCFGD
jgi:hypothetical protein